MCDEGDMMKMMKIKKVMMAMMVMMCDEGDDYDGDENDDGWKIKGVSRSQRTCCDAQTEEKKVRDTVL